jgi:cysteine desulfurase
LKVIYLDHQATTPIEAEVETYMRPFWSERFGNPHATEHAIGLNAARVVDEARTSVASTLACEMDEVFFTSGATEGNNQVIFGICASQAIEQSRKRVIVSEIEHKCVQEAAKYWTSIFGLDLQILGVDRFGYVDLEQLENLLKTPTRLVSIMAVNNEIGTIQNLNRISEMVWDAGALFHSDCAQALKALPQLEVSDFADLATFSGHKIGGPQGVGACFISADLQNSISPLILGGGQQNGIRAGTLPLPLVAGVGKAFELRSRLGAVNEEAIRTKYLRDNFFGRLRDARPEILLNGPSLDERHAGNLNIQFPNTPTVELLARLRSNIAASSGSACSSGAINPSYVLRAIGLNDAEAKSSVRFGFSEKNNLAELNKALELILVALTT